MGKGQMYSWGKKGCHQGFEWSMNTWIFSYMGAKKYERNIKGNIKGIHEYSHMGAKKVPMAEKRTYPGSELTWRRNRETCQKEIMKNSKQKTSLKKGVHIFLCTGELCPAMIWKYFALAIILKKIILQKKIIPEKMILCI